MTNKSSRHRPLPPLLSLNSYFAHLVAHPAATHVVPSGPPAAADLTVFALVPVEEVATLLTQLNPNKAPGSDGLLPGLLKDVAAEIAPSITVIFNKSLSSGIVPTSWKEATITPIQKSDKLDPARPASYHGISLLPVISKQLESIVQRQLADFWTTEAF